MYIDALLRIVFALCGLQRIKRFMRFDTDCLCAMDASSKCYKLFYSIFILCYKVFYIQNHRHFCRDREVRGEEGRGEKRGCLLKRRGEARREKMLENKNEKA